MMRVILGLAAIGITATAVAQPMPTSEAKEKARQHSDSCIKAYDLAEYARAIAECKAAYELFPAPLLLYSIAQANRKSGQPALAIQFYRKYIAKAPTGSQRALAEEQIALLTPIVEAAERSRTAPPEGAGAEDASRRNASPLVVAAQPQATVVVASPPRRNRRWVWGVVVGGVVVAGLAIGLGVGLAPHSISYPSVNTTAGTVRW